MQLPTLKFDFEIRADCADGRQATSLSLNVADSRLSLTAEQISSDGPTALSLTIPSEQIAPLAVEGFCVVDEQDGEGLEDPQTELAVSAAFSAQASLLCEGAEDKAMTYVSRPLDIALLCHRPAADEDPVSE